MSEGKVKNLITTAGKYFSLVKFSHTVFAMPFAMIGFALAISEKEQTFSLRLLLLIILCMVFARNSAMGFNRVADMRFDSLNPRTDRREIPAGKISPSMAMVFVIINSILFIVTCGFINRLTLILSPVALIVILGYSLTKRWTALCHFILGTGLALAPVGAFISVTGAFRILPLIYSFIVLSWSSGFDIIYSLQDDEFDREHHLHSLPSSAGRKNALIISGIVHLVTVMLVIAAGLEGNGHVLYWTGALIFMALLVYQHLIVRPDELSRVTLAFQTVNGIASILFAVFVILDLIFRV
jgi:4-hydroxybenzoate polyprenyltransferase